MAKTVDEIKIGARNSAADAARIQAAHDTLCDLGAECKDPSRMELPDKGNALKAVSETPEELRVANYIILFGGRDLTGAVHEKNKDGSSGEFFSPRTELESSYTKTGILHVDFEHGRDPDNLGITDDDVLGFVDWKTARKDERGVFVERVLNRRNQYVQWIEELIKAGLVGNSSEAVRGKTEKTASGEIVKWPLKRDTLTVNPMEPRMLNENVFAAIKGLSEKYPALKSLIIGDTPQEPVGALVDAATKTDPILAKEEPAEMTPEEIKALVDQAAKAAVEEYKRAEPATVTAGANVTVVKDEADQPFKSHEFFQAVKNAALNPRDEDKRLRPLKATGMSEGVPADGGYLVPPAVAAGIQQVMFNTGAILSRVAMDSVSGNSMTYNILDETTRVASRFGGVVGYWLNEGGTKTASAPKFKQLELKLKKVAALCYATDELLADANALNGWISRNVADELRFQTEAAMFYGDGVGKPLGFLTAPGTVSVTRTDANKVQIADVVGMYARRLGNGPFAWFINREVMVQLMQLAGTYQYVWMPPGGLADSPFARLLGYPVIEVEYASALGTVGDIVLADMGMYQVITKGGIEAASSIHVKFTTDETAFRFVYRVDGAPMLSSAITPHKGSGTLSPFVTLSTAS